MIHCRVLSIVVFLALLSFNCSARDLWVDKDSRGGACSDSRAAVSVTKSTPLCSLGAAADLVAPGDVVHVRGGVYSQTHNCGSCEDRAVLQLVRAGTASQWIRFVAEPGESVILEGSSTSTIGLRIARAGSVVPSFNEVSGFQIRRFSRDCVFSENVPDIRLVGLDVSQCTRGAMQLHQAQRVTLLRSRIHDNNTNGWTSAIDLYQCKDGNVVSGNVVWNNADQSAGNPDSEGHGLILDNCASSGGARIENNVIFNNEGWCIAVLNSNNALIRNNVCYHNGIRQDGSGEISVRGNRLAIYNNIMVPRSGQLAFIIKFSNSSFAVDPSTIAENNNLLNVNSSATAVVWGEASGTLAQYRSSNGRGWGSQDIAADPRFVDPAATNFRLQAGSPAIDKGSTAQGTATDFDGQPRPQGSATDIGAYEASTGPTLAGSMITSTAAVNLTSGGTRDWAKWPNYIRKANVAVQISNAAIVGGAIPWVYNGDPRIISWSDGTPTVAASDQTGMALTGVGKGFQIAAPAGIGMRTLKVYIASWHAVGKLSAQLSDNSVPAYVAFQGAVDSRIGTVVTLSYRAKTDGQRLIVNWQHSSGSGNVQLQAATLQ